MIQVNEAGVQVTKRSLYDRLRFLWRVILYVWKPDVYIDIHREVDEFGRIVISGWIKRPGEAEHKYHYVNYDGRVAPSGYIDGRLISEVDYFAERKLPRRIIDVKQKNIGSPS